MLTEQDEKTTANSNKVRYIMNTNTATSTAITYNQETADRCAAEARRILDEELAAADRKSWLRVPVEEDLDNFINGQSLFMGLCGCTEETLRQNDREYIASLGRSAYDQIGRGLSLTGLENWLAERYMDIAREYLRGQALMFRDVYSDLTGICEWASGTAKEIESYANVGDIDAEIRDLTQQDIDNAGIIAGEE